MARAPKKAAALTFDDDKHYEVKLSKTIKMGDRNISPSARLIQMKGKVAKQHAEAITHARAVE